jgi:heptosyltransferase-2
MALHIAIALDKKLVLFNNIFNRNEFELYGLGEIIEPDVECLCCFKGECDQKCMDLIKPSKVFEACERILNRSLSKSNLLP